MKFTVVNLRGDKSGKTTAIFGLFIFKQRKLFSTGKAWFRWLPTALQILYFPGNGKEESLCIYLNHWVITVRRHGCIQTELGLQNLHAAAPVSESKESLVKAAVEEEQEEEEEEEDSPASSESVRRAGGSRGLGKSQSFSFPSLSSAARSLGPFVMAARGGNSE